METVHSGWLIKSPPEKRLWRAKWRRRWFVLRQSGQIPGQYLLEYYTDTTCKKLKGKIDLDQCDQVDAGLTFESRKWDYQFMFDIRTPKRIYLLVAETESEMNKWVDCICSVCGLKIDVEEEPTQIEEPVQLTVINQPQPATVQPETIPSQEVKLDDDDVDSPSGPYIPISECVTGKASVVNGCNYGTLKKNGSFLMEERPPPPPNKLMSDRRLSGEFYDYPRPIHPTGLDEMHSSPDLNADDLFKVPPLKSPTTPSGDTVFEDSWPSYSAPRVNWDTYPRDGGEFSEGRDTLMRRIEHVYINASDHSRVRKRSQEIYENVIVRKDSLSDAESHDGNSTVRLMIPPRPPKPAHLTDVSQTNYQNVIVSANKVIPAPVFSSSPGGPCAYDVPPSVSKDGTVNSHGVCLDEMYDFPRPLQEDSLNAMPPAPSNTLTHSRRHFYSNAPVGYVEDSVFVSESRSQVTLTGESYLSMDLQKLRVPELYTDMSGESRSPSSSSSSVVVYTNLPSPLASSVPAVPPVHRDLKPNRRGSEGTVVVSRSCSSASSTDVSAKSPSPVEIMVPPSVNRELKPKRSIEEGNKQNSITLAPPPVCRIKSTNTKRSFRKPRSSPSPTHVNHGVRGHVTLPSNTHPRTHSSSDDDHSSSGGSRRNSTNDEQQTQRFFTFTSLPSRREPEIQYLELELEADLAQSPKSPERIMTSTVYKTVDFVKTKAFNETRQNVEETYRKSQ